VACGAGGVAGAEPQLWRVLRGDARWRRSRARRFRARAHAGSAGPQRPLPRRSVPRMVGSTCRQRPAAGPRPGRAPKRRSRAAILRPALFGFGRADGTAEYRLCLACITALGYWPSCAAAPVGRATVRSSCRWRTRGPIGRRRLSAEACAPPAEHDFGAECCQPGLHLCGARKSAYSASTIRAYNHWAVRCVNCWVATTPLLVGSITLQAEFVRVDVRLVVSLGQVNHAGQAWVQVRLDRPWLQQV
jgi:hypothetical protein